MKIQQITLENGENAKIDVVDKIEALNTKVNLEVYKYVDKKRHVILSLKNISFRDAIYSLTLEDLSADPDYFNIDFSKILSYFKDYNDSIVYESDCTIGIYINDFGTLWPLTTNLLSFFESFENLQNNNESGIEC